MSDNQHLRLSSETNDKREVRLDHMSDNQHLRLAAETNSERTARLEHQSANLISGWLLRHMMREKQEWNV